jgi:hypothetical protein
MGKSQARTDLEQKPRRIQRLGARAILPSTQLKAEPDESGLGGCCLRDMFSASIALQACRRTLSF